MFNPKSLHYFALAFCRLAAATTTLSAVEPRPLVIEHPGKADPEADCRAALQAGDGRFLKVPGSFPAPMGGGVDYPGVPRYAEHLIKERGARSVQAISDGIVSKELLARRYADRYNRFLLKQIPGSDQPPPGYGIPKPDDVVGKGPILTTGNIAQGRDLKSYDDGGSCAFSRYLDSPAMKDRCNFPRVRAFVWEHWHQKQRGYIRIGLAGVDTSSAAHLFIERDAKGIWHIALRWVFSGGVTHPAGVVDATSILSVVRVKHEKFDLPGGSYALSFRAADGSKVWRL